MVEPTTTASTPPVYLRSTSDQVAFWLLWVLLLIPAIFLLLMTMGGGLSVILLALVPQLFIHGFSLKWFLDSSKPFSKAMLLLLGGTGLLYFLAFSGCVLLIFTA